jgi:hypothetical protein
MTSSNHVWRRIGHLAAASTLQYGRLVPCPAYAKRFLMLGAAALLAGCALARGPDAQMENDGREDLRRLAADVERAAAKTDAPWPTGSSSVVGSTWVNDHPSGRSRDVVLRSLGEYDGPFDEQSKWFGSCLRVTWETNARRIEQVACPDDVLNRAALPIEQELEIRQTPVTVPRAADGRCDSPISKRDYAQCGD